MEALKPCPFCGHDNPMILDRVWDWDEPAVYWVECRRCDAKTAEEDNERDARANWNKRS